MVAYWENWKIRTNLCFLHDCHLIQNQHHFISTTRLCALQSHQIEAWKQYCVVATYVSTFMGRLKCASKHRVERLNWACSYTYFVNRAERSCWVSLVCSVLLFLARVSVNLISVASLGTPSCTYIGKNNHPHLYNNVRVCPYVRPKLPCPYSWIIHELNEAGGKKYFTTSLLSVPR